MTAPHRRARAARFAARGRERRELERRTPAERPDRRADVERHLEEAALAAAQAGMIVLAGRIRSLLTEAREKPW